MIESRHPMLPNSARLYSTTLRRAAIEGLRDLQPAAEAALERDQMMKHERGLLCAAILSLLALLHRRVGLRVAVVIFLGVRTIAAGRLMRPDPRQIIPREILLATLGHTGVLVAETTALATLSALLAACSLSAIAELTVRTIRER